MRSRVLTSAILLAFAAGASASSAEDNLAPAGSIPGVAYAMVSDGSNFEYATIRFGSGVVDIGPLQTYFFSGGFVQNDFTHEYAIDYPNADLYSIDTSNASTALIGNVAVGSGEVIHAGPRWDPVGGESFLVATDTSCDNSTLYTIDVSTAAATEVGSSSGTCIVAIAIDPTGALYGLDLTSDTLMAIDKLSGAAQPIAPLGADLALVVGMDFNPADGKLYVVGEDAVTRDEGIYVLGTGGLTLVGPTSIFGPFAFAVDSETIFFNGFELP